MKIKNFLILLPLILTLSCAVKSEKPKVTDLEYLQGTWMALTETLNGIKKNVSFLYEFKKDTIAFTDETGKVVKYMYKLDTSGKIKLLNLWPEGTPASSSPVSVGYELSEDSLKIVVAPPGLVPTEISDKNNQELIVCRRKGS